MKKGLVVFTDLDGTLLDARDYSFGPAREALGLLRDLNIPLVLTTSKTRAEVLEYRKALNNPHPFIVENGGCVYIPEGYFPFEIEAPAQEGFHKIELGKPYRALRVFLYFLRESGFNARGFGDMSDEEVAALTGLSPVEAGLARAREYDEPFIFENGGGRLEELERLAANEGLSLTKGRFLHLKGCNDKGQAVGLLKDCYSKVLDGMATAGLGDNANDGPMLDAVDFPFLVKKPDGTYAAWDNPRIVRTQGVGPEGWNEAVVGLLKILQLL